MEELVEHLDERLVTGSRWILTADSRFPPGSSILTTEASRIYASPSQ
jgi:hypothetical protein